MAQAGGERLASRVGVDVAHQPDVELDEVGPELGDVAEAGISGAGVVNRETDRSTSLDGPSQGGVALDLLVLGDLDDDGTVGAGDRLGSMTVDDRCRREVDAEPRLRWKASSHLDGGGDSGRLELGAEAHGAGIGEVLVGGQPVLEPGQRLVATNLV